MTASNDPAAAAPGRPTAPAVTTKGRRFCQVWLAALLAVVALVGAINALIDPYLVIGAPRIAGLNAVKPEVETHGQLAKDYVIARVHPVGVLLGDSKVDIGVDPDSPNWPAESRPVFNYGVPGEAVVGVIANLRRAIALGSLRRALVLIELEHFMAPAEADGVQPPELAMTPPSGLQDIRQRASDLLLATLSLDALRASILTVAAQGRPDTWNLSPAGATGEGGFRAMVATDGTAALFLQKDSYLAQRTAHLAAGLSALPGAGLSHLDALADMIALCRRNNITLDLAIAPFHADYLEALDQAGLWPRYEQAKQELTRLVAAEGGDSVRLWDFLGYDAYSTEPVPGASDRGGSTNWFWEPSHFKRVLGEKILATIYRDAAGYGVRLTPDTIGVRLATEAQAKAVYQARINGSRDRLANVARLEPEPR